MSQFVVMIKNTKQNVMINSAFCDTEDEANKKVDEFTKIVTSMNGKGEKDVEVFKLQRITG